MSRSEGLAKKRENFIFFRITNVDSFRRQLASFVPLVTSVTQAKGLHKDINDSKQKAKKEGSKPPLLKLSAINIAFSQKGLNKVCRQLKSHLAFCTGIGEWS